MSIALQRTNAVRHAGVAALRHWFLASLLLAACIIVVQPDWLGWTLRIEPRYVIVAMLVLVSGSTASRRLLDSLLRPLPAVCATLMSFGLAPALAWLIGRWLPLDLRVGIALIASAPCTMGSAIVWTRMAGGNEGTAFLVILATTASSWLVTPALLYLWLGASVAIDPRSMMLGLLVTMIAPVAAGQMLRLSRGVVEFTRRRRAMLGVGAQLAILTVIVRSGVEVRSRIMTEPSSMAGSALALTVIGCLCLHAAVASAGFALGGAAGFSHADRTAIAIAGSQKTLPIALLIQELSFPEYPLAIVPLLVYHVGQFILDTFIIRWVRAEDASAAIRRDSIIETAK